MLTGSGVIIRVFRDNPDYRDGMYKNLTRITAALSLAGMLSACAAFPLTDQIKPERETREDEHPNGPKAEAIVRVAKGTATRGDLPTALSLYRRAHVLDAYNFDAALGLGLTLNQLGAPQDAVEALEIALKLRPKSVEALRQMGNALIVTERAVTAVRYLERALIEKEDARLYNSIGVAHDMIGEYRKAQAYYRTGLKISGASLSLRNNLGLSLMLNHDINDAIIELRKSAASVRSTARYRRNLALALVLAGENQSARTVVLIDLPENLADQQIAYYETIKALGKTDAARDAIRAHIQGTKG